ALYEHEFETGIMLRWNVFDGGINRSKAKEYEYLKKAKEAELLAKRQENERLSRATKEILAQSRRSVAELKDIVEQSKVLTDSAARAYDAGKETYINSVNAYLSSEAAVREWINARHDLVMNQVLAKAQVGGWNKPLVEDVDRLFVSSK
ncbi:MAG TPA: TolC family protein, partial [Bryobacteraceae bacterium]|nr:TolC family protein [Bryobacteraceae bacterium]